MGKLWIISVKGPVPHSAAFFDYDSPQQSDYWLGFGPAAHHSPGWPKSTPSKIFTDDETHRLNHGIIFKIPDNVMLAAAKAVTKKYTDKEYKVLVVDCVSFTADIAREVGLRVPPPPLFSPYGLIEILSYWNDYEKKW